MKNDEEQFLNGIFCITMSGENRHRHACAHVYFLERNKEKKPKTQGEGRNSVEDTKIKECTVLYFRFWNCKIMFYIIS